MRTGLTLLAIAFLTVPAQAWNGVQIPEPSNMALFGLGVLGVLVGRRAARRRKPRED